MKMTKKLFAAVMALVMLLCMVPVTASAAGEPTIVCVGELYKTKDNLVDKLRIDGPLIRVMSVRDYENYYEFTYEDGVGYVLTFYNAYSMSDLIDNRNCGLYANGDLTVRLDVSKDFADNHPGRNANITFDLNEKFTDPQDSSYEADTTGANGWVVDGTLTIECVNTVEQKARLNIFASKEQDDRNSIGIKTQMLLLNNVDLRVNGGNIGVDASDTIGMIRSSLTANKDASLKKNDEYLFNYSIRTVNLLEANHSTISEQGPMLVSEFWGAGNDPDCNDGIEPKYNPVSYSPVYCFYVQPSGGAKAVSLLWRERFQLFFNASAIPGCVKIANPFGVDTRRITHKKYAYNWLSIDGNYAVLRRPTSESGVVLELRLVCGSASYLMDSCRVYGRVAWWQFIPYFLSFDWAR